MSRLQTSAPGAARTSARWGDDELYQEGAGQIAEFQRRVEIDEHSAQGTDLEGDDLGTARGLISPLLIAFALVAGLAFGIVIGRFILGGSLT